MNIVDQPKIRVVVRKRPLNKKEQGRGETDVVEVRSGSSVIVREMKQKVDLTKFIDEHHFNFDSAFDEMTSNQQIYENCVRPIVQCAFLGAKVTCFAYGQTGSGKTYTMNGDPQSKTSGMYVLGAQDIFDLKEKPEFRHLTVAMSFYEIYCGKLFDLLNNRETLQAREDAKQNVNIIGLTEKKIMNVGSFIQVIEQGSAVRITSQNSTNADSSRSHAIMQISLLDGKKLFGKISFIDLAGCQRGADTIDQNKQTRIDGAEINKSLLALKECIRALDCGKAHTPFRGSKLTMVLKDSFTGFCRTLMIGNISPNSISCENTLNTLRYADRVKQLKKTGAPEIFSKEDQLAKELMLPRMLSNCLSYIENKQTVELNSDGEEQSPKLHTIPSVPQPPPVRSNPRKLEEDNRQRSQRDTSQNHNMGVNKNKRHYRDENENGYNKQDNRRGVSAFQRIRPQNLMNTSNNPNQSTTNAIKKKTQRASFINNTNVLNRATPQQRQESKRQQSDLWHKPKLQQRPYESGGSQLLECSEYNEWQQILEEFRAWQPQHEGQVEKMSGKFETLVNYIMREQIEVLELHKLLIESQKALFNEELKLYNDVLQQDKSNEQFLSYADSLQGTVESRIGMLFNLKNKLSSYKYHLKEHELCEKKLFKASEKFVQHESESEQPIQLSEDFSVQYESHLPSARLFQNNVPPPSVNNYVNNLSNFNSQPGNPSHIVPQAAVGYSQQHSNPFYLPNGYQHQLHTQPIQKGQASPYISDFSTNHSTLFDRLGLAVGSNTSQLFHNKSDCY